MNQTEGLGMFSHSSDFWSVYKLVKLSESTGHCFAFTLTLIDFIQLRAFQLAEE